MESQKVHGRDWRCTPMEACRCATKPRASRTAVRSTRIILSSSWSSTQTGLRGIASVMLAWLVTAPGAGFEPLSSGGGLDPGARTSREVRDLLGTRRNHRRCRALRRHGPHGATRPLHRGCTARERDGERRRQSATGLRLTWKHGSSEEDRLVRPVGRTAALPENNRVAHTNRIGKADSLRV